MNNNLTPEQAGKFKDQLSRTRNALIDMDGVLYDSMKYHTLAWQQVMAELGILSPRDEFYLYEGMTGEATINLLWQRTYGKKCSPESVKKIYARKSRIFNTRGKRELMPGADRMLQALQDAGIKCVLVTGSGQQSILEAISTDYPGKFPSELRITAHDVVNGKPHPEPYLKGLRKAGGSLLDTIVIENAPLGVRAGKAAGLFTIAVTTGPIPPLEFEKENADIIFGNMPGFADALKEILPPKTE